MRGVLTDSAELESSKSIGVPSIGDSAEFVVGVLTDSAEFESSKSTDVLPSAIQLNSLWESSSWESSPIQLNRS